MKKTQREVVMDVGMRRLHDPKLKQEKLHMDMKEIIFEYGKLQLNFVAVSTQNQQLSQALSDANKQIAALKAQLAPPAESNPTTVDISAQAEN